MHSKKAQGTIEYLVIIAIVIVIALVVVGLLLQIMGQNSGINETAAKAAWKSAEPWAMVDWVRTTNGTLTVVLQNNSSDSLNFIDMNLSTNALDKNTTYTTNIAPGATIIMIIATTGTCTSGTKYSYPKSTIYIDYNNVNISRKVQVANADLVGTC